MQTDNDMKDEKVTNEKPATDGISMKAEDKSESFGKTL